MQLSLAPYHTGDMLSDIVGMLWLRAKEKGLEFHIDVAPELPAELYGDEVRIKQILINVLNNAIKYTKEGSVTLSIECEKRKRGEEKEIKIIYTVRDTGMGIKKESIPHLFTAFRRVDEERNRYIEGTGLGLSIVKQLVDLMGGKITVNSVYTKGSTFIIEIPQEIVSQKTLGKLDVEQKHSLNRREHYHQSFEAPDARILVVDDNASNLLVVSKLLRDTKVVLHTAASGEEALKKTLDMEYHLIFMDHMMPEMDGIECFHKIRIQIGGRNKMTKIVALTANAGSEMKELYEREGFDGYLLKPVTGEALENELLRLLPKELVSVTSTNREVVEESVSWMERHQKKSSVLISTESVADLPKELIERYQIAVLPHMVTTEDGIFQDGLEIESRGLLAYMEDENHVAGTMSPGVEAHEAFFAEQLTKANNIIHVSISSKVENSGCPAAMEAAKVFENVSVIDTGHLSSGQGLMVLEACRMAEAGKNPAEIIERLERMKTQVHTSFIVDNLDYLARANQISKRIARITKVLMVHPVLALKNGKMVVRRIHFGTKERSWERYISSAFDVLAIVDHGILFVTYVGLTKKELDKIRSEVQKRHTFKEIYFQKASPAIAVNCGAGTFGLIFQTEGK
ncbi:MAG: DegV family EDD domain-containing protein, partial [Lachnospiraceae bacterium]|nr:DegV family EDD domain-containing protein [Lachnospiraceae bacterium]